MTEIDIGFYETCQFSSKADSNKSDDYFDVLWSKSPSLDFIPLNSPGSTKSACSIPDSLHRSSLNASPPWRIDEEDYGEAKDDMKDRAEMSFIPAKDCELEEALAFFWPSTKDEEECVHASKPLTINTENVISQLPQPPSFLSVALEVENSKEGVIEETNPLEHQLASADTAWTAAVEFPTLAAEDVDQLLNGGQQRSKSQKMNHRMLIGSRKRLCTSSPFFSSISCSKKKKIIPSKSTLNIVNDASDRYNPISEENVDEETDTGSEAEECNRTWKQNSETNRRRRKIFLCGREEIVEDLDDEISSNESENSEFDCMQKVRQSELSPAAAITEAWWPDDGQLRSTTELNTNLSPTHWYCRKNRKQYELWEFILKSLNTQTSSAFKWVNKSIGVFRISDTRKAAREWGRYRNNSRMNYEKMARAMRFYYKGRVLRKARKQLHFQFSMKFVEWSKRRHLEID